MSSELASANGSLKTQQQTRMKRTLLSLGNFIQSRSGRDSLKFLCGFQVEMETYVR